MGCRGRRARGQVPTRRPRNAPMSLRLMLRGSRRFSRARCHPRADTFPPIDQGGPISATGDRRPPTANRRLGRTGDSHACRTRQHDQGPCGCCRTGTSSASVPPDRIPSGERRGGGTLSGARITMVGSLQRAAPRSYCSPCRTACAAVRAVRGGPRELDLGRLSDVHPLLPPTTAADLATRAAVALSRQGHPPGISLQLRLPDARPSLATLRWNTAPSGAMEQMDRRRITEDGAEAVALMLVGVVCAWRLRRRLQQGEYADWLLRDATGRAVALEISGTEGDRDSSRMASKLSQVASCPAAPMRFACVVAFAPPAADLEAVKGGINGP